MYTQELCAAMRRSDPLTQRADIGAELPATWSDILRLVSVRRQGHVGIGTSTPSSTIHAYSSGTYGTGLQLQNGDTGGRDWWILSNATMNGGGAGLFNIYDGTASATRLVINSSGNVGIGTTSPTNTLQVGASASSASPSSIYVGTYSSSAGYASYIGNWSSGGVWGIGPATFSADNTVRSGNAAAGWNSAWSATQNLNLVIGGNVGIGTSSAAGLLDVARNVSCHAAGPHGVDAGRRIDATAKGLY